MKKFLFLLAAALTAAFLTAEPDRLRIMSYNIRDGFDPAPSKTQATNSTEGNRKNFVIFMNERKPDILCMQELCKNQGLKFTEDVLKTLANDCGLPHVVFLPISYGIGIASKYPIEVIEKHPGNGFRHGYLHVRICGLDIITTHLSPTYPPDRIKEVTLLSAHIRKNCPTRCLIMGDFNSRSPFDTDRKWNSPAGMNLLDDRYHNKYKNLKSHDDYSVVAGFMAIPMIDTLHLFVPINERMTNPVHRETFPGMSERIDYIFITPDLRPYLKDGRIWNNVPFRKNSDHAVQELDLETSVIR